MDAKRALFGLGLSTLMMTTANAADLGGNCCADLEERIAELEATTVKKGNRKVSLTLSGYVSHSLLRFDDGKQHDIFIGDGGAVSSRFRLVGEARMNADVTAGFLYEFGLQNNRLGSMNQLNGGDDLGGNIEVRQSTVYLQHKGFGKVQVGHGSTATDDLILIDTSNAGVLAFSDVAVFNGSFLIRSQGSLTPITWGQMFNSGVSFDTARRNHVLYQTPTLAGFTASIAAGENDFFDVALRHASEISGFLIAGGVGYSEDSETPAFGPFGLNARKIKDYKGSASVKHQATGLFVTAAAAKREIDWSYTSGGFSASARDSHFWHLHGGIERNVFGIGASTAYVEFQQAKDMLGYQASFGPSSVTIGSDAQMWGVGAVQKVDALGLDVFAGYKNFSAEAKASGSTSGKIKADDMNVFIVGTRIQF